MTWKKIYNNMEIKAFKKLDSNSDFSIVKLKEKYKNTEKELIISEKELRSILDKL